MLVLSFNFTDKREFIMDLGDGRIVKILPFKDRCGGKKLSFDAPDSVTIQRTKKNPNGETAES